MILVTTEYLQGKEFEMLGLVEGNSIQNKNAVKDFFQDIKSMAGGELKEYVDMLNKSRKISKERMIEQAKKMGADAIVGVAYSSTPVWEGVSETVVYGTAVKLK